jgi:uncharacterized repeat protein (TIGR03847 family)
MSEFIELDDIEGLGAGAVGQPGERSFYLQARTDRSQLTVLVEKEQVALLAAEAVAFLDRIADDYPELPVDVSSATAELVEPTVPLFRARLIGLGFDTERELVLLELRERPEEDDVSDDEGAAAGEATGLDTGRETGLGSGIDPGVDRGLDPHDEESDEGYVARIYATRAQVRAMAARGIEVVSGGRPPCPLCDMPMDPAGHRCPRWN